MLAIFAIDSKCLPGFGDVGCGEVGRWGDGEDGEDGEEEG